MTKKSLIDAFDIQRKVSKTNITSDYEIFNDKELLDNLRARIMENLINKEIPEDKLLNQFINDEIDATIMGYDLSNLERSHLFNLIDNEINGYGPITELLEDKNITEIMVNSPNEIFIEIDGELIKDESVSFINNEHILRTIERLIERTGRTIDSKNPIIDMRLLDGSHLNAIIPPLSPKGPVMTIRKFRDNMDNIEDLIRIGVLTPYMARFLYSAVKSKLNIVVCGNIGSGKTSILNVIAGFIDENERIITIEDAEELRLKQPNVVSLSVSTTNYNKNEEITVHDLIVNSLRMHPDRLIVGELRGTEAYLLLQAMNTGLSGSLTTIHANSIEDGLNRLENMVLLSGIDIPGSIIREYITNAIDLIVFVERLSDGKRKITSILEFDGVISGHIKLKEIFKFKQKGITEDGEVDGEFVLYKTPPKVYKKMVDRGINDLEDMFNKK